MMWISGLVILGCFGSVGAFVGLIAMVLLTILTGTKLTFWLFVPIVLFIYFAWKFGLRSVVGAVLMFRRGPMQVEWESRYGSSYLMPDAFSGETGKACEMSGVYQQLWGEEQRVEVERGQGFPLAKSDGMLQRVKWEMAEYPLSPGWFLLGVGLVQRVQMVERQRNGKGKVLSLDGGGG